MSRGSSWPRGGTLHGRLQEAVVRTPTGTSPSRGVGCLLVCTSIDSVSRAIAV